MKLELLAGIWRSRVIETNWYILHQDCHTEFVRLAFQKVAALKFIIMPMAVVIPQVRTCTARSRHYINQD